MPECTTDSKRAQYARAAMVCACTNFRKATRVVTQLFDHMLQPSGLRSTQLILLLEIAAAGTITVSLLARRLVLDPSTVLRNLRPLQQQGWIYTASGKSRRPRTVALTPQGSQILEEAIPLWEQAQRLLTEQLGDQRWRRLVQELQATVDEVRRIPRD
jgi:DNA-binding MarR family transcriptional regulator